MVLSSVMDIAPFFPQVAEGPDDVKAYWIEAEDKVRLRVAHWRSDDISKGTVFVFQGRTENIEKYGRAVDGLHKAGYAAFAIDWRGQGLSDRLTDDRMMGYVDRYSDYQKDVAAMLKAAHTLDLPKPWYLFGHSLGACIGLRALSEGLPMTACAFSAPLWDINLPALQRFAAWPLTWAAQLIGKSRTYAPGTRGESYVLTNAIRRKPADTRPKHVPVLSKCFREIGRSASRGTKYGLALPNPQGNTVSVKDAFPRHSMHHILRSRR